MLAANPLSACNGPEGPAYPSTTSFDSSMRTPFITVRRLASHIKHQHNTLRNRTRLSPLMHRHRVVLRHDCLRQPNHQIIQHTPFHSIPRAASRRLRYGASHTPYSAWHRCIRCIRCIPSSQCGTAGAEHPPAQQNATIDEVLAPRSVGVGDAREVTGRF